MLVLDCDMATAEYMPDTTCTVAQLNQIITAPSGGLTMLPSRDMDEVYPSVFIGEESAARNLLKLKFMKFTHILNTAMGKDAFHVNTNHVMYRKEGMQFLGIEATDAKDFQINKFFDRTSDFIESAKNSDGRILVHCREGASRSTTIVLAYLMMKEHMPLPRALKMVRERREVCPNDGFLEQLCNLNDHLAEQGHYHT